MVRKLILTKLIHDCNHLSLTTEAEHRYLYIICDDNLSESFDQRRLCRRQRKLRHYLGSILAFPLSIFTLSCALCVSPPLICLPPNVFPPQRILPPTRLPPTYLPSMRLPPYTSPLLERHGKAWAEARAEAQVEAQVEVQVEL